MDGDESLIPDEPVTRCVPAVWHFGDVKSLVMESGGLISAEEAKRRVLILKNPALHGESRITNTLFAGIQMIIRARSRRLTATPLRPFASYWTGRAPTRRLKAKRRSCRRAIS